jgi:hypothetical protein
MLNDVTRNRPTLESTSLLSLQVKHESGWLKPNQFLCGAEFLIGRLMENDDQAQGTLPRYPSIILTNAYTLELELRLSNPSLNASHHGQPRITICLTSQTHRVAGKQAIADARQILQDRVFSDVTGDDPRGLCKRRGAAQALASIVSKLDTFVNIADKTAKVTWSAALCCPNAYVRSRYIPILILYGR